MPRELVDTTYVSGDIVRYSIAIDPDAADDLESLYASDPDEAALAEALLQEIGVCQDLLDALTVHGFGNKKSPFFSVSKWHSFWGKGIDIWRIRADHSNYRIIYAYFPPRRVYHVLAIVHRKFDYDPINPAIKYITYRA